MWQPGAEPPPLAVVAAGEQGVLAGAAGFVSRDSSDIPCVGIAPPSATRQVCSVAQLWLCSVLTPGRKCEAFSTSFRNVNIVEPFALFTTSCFNKTDLYKPAIDRMAGHVESTIHEFLHHLEDSDYMAVFRAQARQLGKNGGSVVTTLAEEPLKKALAGAVHTFNTSKTYQAAYVRAPFNLTRGKNAAYEIVFRNNEGDEVSRLLVCAPYQFGCEIACNACNAAYKRDGHLEMYSRALWAQLYDGEDNRPPGV